MRILMVGDVVGKPGRVAVQRMLPDLRRELEVDFVLCNGENSAGGFGLTLSTVKELLESGVDVVTAGNHTWDQRQFQDEADTHLPVIRPLNFSPGQPGRGWIRIDLGALGSVLVVNLMGRLYGNLVDDPFRTVDSWLAEQSLEGVSALLVDMHAEATSEKLAMGWFLNGRVSCVVGTHTHVPTADARVLPGGTGYVTDLGMVGPRDGVIGMDRDRIITKFLNGLPSRFVVAEGPVQFNAVLFEVEALTRRCLSARRVDREL